MAQHKYMVTVDTDGDAEDIKEQIEFALRGEVGPLFEDAEVTVEYVRYFFTMASEQPVTTTITES